MGAEKLISIEESESEEQSDNVEDSARFDSDNQQIEYDFEPSSWRISKVIAADDQILNIQVLKSHFTELSISKSVQYAFNGQQAIDFVKEIFLSGLKS